MSYIDKMFSKGVSRMISLVMASFGTVNEYRVPINKIRSLQTLFGIMSGPEVIACSFSSESHPMHPVPPC